MCPFVRTEHHVELLSSSLDRSLRSLQAIRYHVEHDRQQAVALGIFLVHLDGISIGGTLSVEVLFDLHIFPILIYYGLRQIEFLQVVLQIAGKHLVHVVVETHMQGVVVAIA